MNVSGHEWHSLKVGDGSSILSGLVVQQEMIEILCDDSTGYISRQRQTLNMSVT